MNREIELKIQLDDENRGVLEAWLKTHATCQGVLTVIDHYLDRVNRTFFYRSAWRGKDTDNYLRVRSTNEESFLCLKKITRDERGHPLYSDEYETVIDDPENALRLMEALGYVKVTTVEKKRAVYTYDIFEIVLDTVLGLGEFVEIELKQPVASVEEGHARIYECLRSIGITRFVLQPQGYVHMMWNPDIDLRETVEL